MDEEIAPWERYQRGPFLGPRPGQEPARQQPATAAGPPPSREPSIYEQRTQVSPDQGLDYADMGKGAVGQFAAGVTGIPGFLGDAKTLMQSGGEWIGNKLGLPPLPEDVKQRNAAFNPPTSADIQRAVEPYTGAFYEPKTPEGKMVGAVARAAPVAFLPGAGASRFTSSSIPGLRVNANTLGQVIGSRALNTAAAPLAAETVGQLMEGSPYEKYARPAAALVGGLAAARTVSPSTVLPNLPVAKGLEATVGGYIGHRIGGPWAAAAGAVGVPYTANQLMQTAPMQRYLANQVAPQSARDVITQILTQQAMSGNAQP